MEFQGHTSVSAFRRIATVGLLLLAAVGFSVSTATPAAAHDELVGVVGEYSGDSDRYLLTLQYNNEVMDIGSELLAAASDGTDLIDGPPVVSGRDVTQNLIVPETDEIVIVNWRVVSSDGHPIQGAVEVQFAGDDTSVAVADLSSIGSATEEAAADETAAADASSEVSTETQEDSGGMPVGVWVVVGIAILVIIGAVAMGIRQQKRK